MAITVTDTRGSASVTKLHQLELTTEGAITITISATGPNGPIVFADNTTTVSFNHVLKVTGIITIKLLHLYINQV